MPGGHIVNELESILSLLEILMFACTLRTLWCRKRHVRKESNGSTLGLCVVPKESHDSTLIKEVTPKESHD